MKHILLALIRAYQWLLSPFVGHHCRFHPTCSHYAADAIRTHGAIKGTVLAARRLLRCHPWHEGGVDLVPPAEPKS
jgi:putative membrane protein insertion efficiency factor